MIPMPKHLIPKPKFIITKEYGGFTIKKRVKKTDYIRFLYFFKSKYEYISYSYILKPHSIIGMLGILKDNVLIFDSKKQAKKYIKENTKKEYFIY